MKIKSCICGNSHLQVRSDDSRDEGDNAFVFCHRCKNRSVVCRCEAIAIRMWNKAQGNTLFTGEVD